MIQFLFIPPLGLEARFIFTSQVSHSRLQEICARFPALAQVSYSYGQGISFVRASVSPHEKAANLRSYYRDGLREQRNSSRQCSFKRGCRANQLSRSKQANLISN